MRLFNIFKSKERIAREKWKRDRPLNELIAKCYWTDELMDWVRNENNAEKLSAASCLINCHKWPEWVPSKPPTYPTMKDDAVVLFTVDVYRKMKDKAESICPGLHHDVWMSGRWRNYKPE